MFFFFSTFYFQLSTIRLFGRLSVRALPRTLSRRAIADSIRPRRRQTGNLRLTRSRRARQFFPDRRRDENSRRLPRQRPRKIRRLSHRHGPQVRTPRRLQSRRSRLSQRQTRKIHLQQNTAERLPGHGNAIHARHSPRQRAARRATHPAETSLSGLQQRNLPAAGHIDSGRSRQRRGLNFRLQTGARGNFSQTVSLSVSFFEGGTLGFSKSGNSIAQASHNALLAKYDHRIEKRRRNRLAHDRHARRINKQAGLDAARFGDRTRCVIASVVVPFAERFQRVREFREEFRRFWIFPEF